MKSINYRPDIDGIRALAVLSVFVFHVDLFFLPGGFLGVDVFFVISGYLITKLLYDNITAGKFSFSTFYLRRVRRLLPALYFTLILSLAAAVILFSAEDLKRSAGAAGSSIFSLSNMYFWMESGYFDASSRIKPFLHTWSLSVEEQFYLIWPLTLFLAIKYFSKRSVPTLLALLALASFILAEILIIGFPSAAFFWMPARIIEFAFGGALIFLPAQQKLSKKAKELGYLLGLVLVLGSMLLIHESDRFPGLSAIPVCAGTAMMIYFGLCKFSSRAFRFSPVVYIGKISYSLYLIHWPIIVFYEHFRFHDINQFERLAIVIAGIIIASGMYHFIEQPFRFPGKGLVKSNKRYVKLCVASSVSLFALCGYIWKEDGLPNRVAKPEKWDGYRVQNVTTFRTKFTEKFKPSLNERTFFYETGSRSPDARKILVYGDSHAGRLGGFTKYFSKEYDYKFVYLWKPACIPLGGVSTIPEKRFETDAEGNQCTKIKETVRAMLKEGGFDHIILTARWTFYTEPGEYAGNDRGRRMFISDGRPLSEQKDIQEFFKNNLERTVEEFSNYVKSVIVISQPPPPAKSLRGCDDVPKTMNSLIDIKTRCQGAPREAALSRVKFVSNTIFDLGRKNEKVHALIPTPYFCPKVKDYCIGSLHNSRLYGDNNHLNKYGSYFMAKNWEKNENFPLLRPAQ